MSYVYFMRPIGFDGPIKIGFSLKPVERLDSLTVWSPFPLELIAAVPGTIKDERLLHGAFADLHSHREWFRYSDELWHVICEIKISGNLRPTIEALESKGAIRKPREYRKPWGKECISYQMRLHHAAKRFSRPIPQRLTSIVRRWSGDAYQESVYPTVDEFAQLNAFITFGSDPATSGPACPPSAPDVSAAVVVLPLAPAATAAATNSTDRR